MRAYIAHNLDGSEDLCTNLETMKSEVVTYWKLVEEGTGLLRNVEEEKEAVQTNTRRLAEEKDAMAADKEKAEERLPNWGRSYKISRRGLPRRRKLWRPTTKNK